MKKINYKTLNIKGIVLDKYKLSEYMEKVASDHNLQPFSDLNTYPIPRLKDNFDFITKTYNLLNEHIKMEIGIYPAAEWILDNYYVIEETLKTVVREITPKKYKKFQGLASGQYKGYARIYVLAAEIVAYTDNKIDNESLKFVLEAYQNKKTLSMDEIWNLQLFLQISIIENIREICEKIYSSQMQKYKVENIVERLVDKKDLKNQVFKPIKDENLKYISYKEMKYPFIEYMSYKLKQYGKQGLPYLNILEEQVEKMGNSISDVIKKEHFEIALGKVSIGNCITSIKEILRIDFLDIFEKINGVEEILKKDPADIYNKMDYKTKEYYRNKIKDISEKTKISEIYIARKTLELCNEAQKNNLTKKSWHVGYYLIDNGFNKLMDSLQCEIKLNSKENKANIYINIFFLVSIISSIGISTFLFYKTNSLILSIITAICIYIPMSEIIIQTMNYILSKSVKPKLIPKLDLYDGVPKQATTFIVIPTIIKDSKKVEELFNKLEIYYLANKSENLHFALLGDASASSNEKENYDNEVIEAGISIADKLNNKYKKDDFPIFHFFYRKRKWNASEKCFLGWERKRGLLCEFNDFLVRGTSDFLANTLQDKEIPNIKYVITLDSDTNLVLNSAYELIGAMMHILNEPVLNDNQTCVVEGHALMQPRIGIDLDVSKKSIFTKIFAGVAGTDSYTNAISDVYQDNFGEGIFTGKGIYDLKIFHKLLHEKIPENTVLSHDLLEGSYLRCGLVSDILLLDGYPSKYNAYINRLHRWIRGDWQIIQWLMPYVKNQKNEKIQNPINKLSKFKIFDNLRRSLVAIFVIVLLLISIFNTSSVLYKIIAIVTIFAPTILDQLNYIIFRKEPEQGYVTAYKSFYNNITILQKSILSAILELCFLPHKAYISMNAIVKTIYRMKVSKQNLLEWMTAEEAEKQAKVDLFSYYKSMFFNVILGILFVLNESIILKILGFAWIIGPLIAWKISKIYEQYKSIDEVSEEDKQYILEIGKKTWGFFNEFINEENNYLPPDNFQEDRLEKVAYRTSPTNIGLGLLAVISAYDLKYIKYEECVNTLEKMLETINKLQKWNGHLYNWYNTKNLEPLLPRYISSVDSGNFIGYLYVLKQFLITEMQNEKDRIAVLINNIDDIIKDTDFSKLYDYKKRLFSIGFNIEENKLTDSYYDLLASEARQASLVAIAKRDIPSKHWNNLSRTLTTLNKYKGLISWSGTAFEYLMPTVNIKAYDNSLLDESCKFMIMSQREYAKKLGIPWGISESAYNLRDLNYNYQYKAFGIPWLGLKRGLADDMVVSSYGLILALPYEPKNVIENIKILEEEGMYSKYGLYESIDYTTARLKYGQKNMPVKTYMAHHQGLILLSINNFINDFILQKRFHNNPEINAVDVLLQERMPDKAIITKENKEKVEKIKLKDYESYSERVFNKISSDNVKTNVISNGNYTICTTDSLEGFSKYEDIYINRFKETADYSQGIIFYIKNIKNKKIWSNAILNTLEKPDKYSVSFAPDNTKVKRVDGNIETITKITTSPDEPLEVRRLEIRNNGNSEEILEISTAFEPILSRKEQDYAHPAFNNLFLKFELNQEIESIIAKRNNREKNEQDLYMAVSFYTEAETIGEFEYEIDKEKFFGRENIDIPIMVKESKTFSKSIGLVVDPIVAMKRTVKIKPQEKVILNFVLAVSKNKEEVTELIKKYRNEQNAEEIFNLASAKAEAESIYLGVKGKDVEIYQQLLSYLIIHNSLKEMKLKYIPKKAYKQSELWKFGISGDFPILLLKIKDVNDIYVVKELLKAYEYFRIKNIKVELVILNEEINSYEQYVQDAIYSAILNQQLEYMQNVNGGIFVINSALIQEYDKDLLMFRANLVLDATLGNVETQLKEFEEDYKELREDIGKDEIIENLIIEDDLENLKENWSNYKFNNEYGAFSEDGTEYHLKTSKNNPLPTVWSNILVNKNFGTVVTQNLGGYTWSKNSRLNRISAWTNQALQDIPSEIIYCKDKKNGKTWSLSSNLNKQNIEFYITYGFGYAIYKMMYDEILQELEVFVPTEDNVKVNILKLKNVTDKRKNLKIIYYIKPVLGEDELKSLGCIDVHKDGNEIYAKNLYSSDFENELMYVSSSEKVQSFTGDKNFFIGDKDIEHPEAIDKVKLNNKTGLGKKACIAIAIDIELEPFENKEISFILGAEQDKTKAKDIAYKYSNVSNCKDEKNKTKSYWYELLDKLKVKTPVDSMNMLLNGWLVYQTITSRILGKTGYYQSGGATGFRDQLQDTLGLKFINPEYMKMQILKACNHQFIEGDVEHWWHDETKRGIRTRFSDDLLWLCYVVLEYIDITGDYEILEEQVAYRDGEILRDGVDELYDIHKESDYKESVYEHCIKAIEKSLDFGKNGLPKIGSGDWNDGFNTVGNKGIGESVWLGFFLYYILNGFINICIEKNENDRAKKYEEIKEKLKKSLNVNGWDGRWFKRAFTDSGQVLGSIENEECRIDSIAQTWGIISNTADNDKKYISLESLENHLIDKENGFIKLLDPPFEKGNIEPGYIKAYLPGVRENGGQYTHAAAWVIMALTYLRFGNKAVEYYKMINPIEHTKTKDIANKYKVEPYVITADIYGANNLAGRGGWTWYTGSSSWFYKVGVENILGLKIQNNILEINPCIENSWEEYSIRYRYKTSIYNIKVKNPNKKNTGVEKFIYNGQEIEEKKIKLIDDGKVNEIEIIM